MPTEAEQEAQLARDMLASPFWGYVKAYLTDRRESLFRADCQTTEQVWENRGQMKMLTELMDFPAKVVIWHRKRLQDATAEALAASGTSGTPSVRDVRSLIGDDDDVGAGLID